MTTDLMACDSLLVMIGKRQLEFGETEIKNRYEGALVWTRAPGGAVDC